MLLCVNNVRKSFGDALALDGVSFEAKEGRPFGLLGRNGAGKTTAMRIIMEVILPDSGEVLSDGKPLMRSGAKLGYLPEERGLYRKSPVGEQLVYFARLRGMNSADAVKAMKGWLERLGVQEYEKRKPESLSKGNQQKIQLALALINDPDIIILDEPFTGLDPVNAHQLREIAAETSARGKIIIFSSHQMSVVEDFCSDIMILKKGKSVLRGELANIRNSFPKNRIRVASDCDMKLFSAFGSVEEGKNSAVVTMKRPERSGELLEAIISSGCSLSAFEILEPTLEEIFISAAGEEGETK